MHVLSAIDDIKAKYGVRIDEYENFKQAVYNGRMTDSGDCVFDKMELILKHYPNTKYIGLSTYQSDETSPYWFCYAVVTPDKESTQIRRKD